MRTAIEAKYLPAAHNRQTRWALRASGAPRRVLPAGQGPTGQGMLEDAAHAAWEYARHVLGAEGDHWVIGAPSPSGNGYVFVVVGAAALGHPHAVGVYASRDLEG